MRNSVLKCKFVLISRSDITVKIVKEYVLVSYFVCFALSVIMSDTPKHYV